MGTAWVKPNLAPAECPGPFCLPRDKNPSVWAQSSWCQGDAPAGMEHPSLGSCRSAPIRGGDPGAAPSLLLNTCRRNCKHCLPLVSAHEVQAATNKFLTELTVWGGSALTQGKKNLSSLSLHLSLSLFYFLKGLVRHRDSSVNKLRFMSPSVGSLNFLST